MDLDIFWNEMLPNLQIFWSLNTDNNQQQDDQNQYDNENMSSLRGKINQSHLSNFSYTQEEVMWALTNYTGWFF